MKHLKKFNELFDTEELKNQNEIPYLSGEFDSKDIVNKWKRVSTKQKQETLDTFRDKLVYEYPLLQNFHFKKSHVNNEDIYSYYGTSFEDVDGVKYYCQISFGFKDGKYLVVTVVRELQNVQNSEEWDVQEYDCEDITEVYEIVDNFFYDCVDLNVVRKTDLTSVEKN